MEKILFFIGFITIISSGLTKLSKRFKVPILLIYLGLGMIIGIYFGSNVQDYMTSKYLGVFSLCYILFSGALEMKFHDVKLVLSEGIILSTMGVLLTTFIIGILIHFIFKINFIESTLIGAIISSTDAAAVISIFNFSKYKVPAKIENLVKFESGSNDPVAYALIIFLISLLQLEDSPSILLAIVKLFVEIILGFILGIGFGKVGEWLLSRLKLGIFEFNQILILGLVAITYSGTELIHGNGFLAIYILGLYLGKSTIAYKNSTIRFYSTVSWIVQIAMFITLGLLVIPNLLLHIWKEALIISLILMFIARPITVFICLHFFKKTYKTNEKFFISWAGLKGAVPIVFGIYPIVSGIPNGQTIFHIVFFVVIISVLLQGTTIDILANKLNITNIMTRTINTHVELDKIEYIENSLVQIFIVPNSAFIGKKIRDLQIPENCLILTIKRDSNYITPTGSTEMLLGDQVFIITPDRSKFIQNYLIYKHAEKQKELLVHQVYPH